MEPASQNGLREKPAAKTLLIRAPLVAVASAMICGIVAGKMLPLPIGVWAIAGAGVLLGGVALFFRRRMNALTTAAVIAAVLCMSAFYVRWTYFTMPSDHIVTFTGPGPILATIEGRIVTAPQTVQDSPAICLPYSRPPRTCFVLEAEKIKTPAGYESATGLVRATVDEPNTLLAAGQLVKLTCWLGRFKSARNPGQPDPAKTAKLNYTQVWAKVQSADGVEVLAAAPQNWLGRIYWRLPGRRWRSRLPSPSRSPSPAAPAAPCSRPEDASATGAAPGWTLPRPPRLPNLRPGTARPAANPTCPTRPSAATAARRRPGGKNRDGSKLRAGRLSRRGATSWFLRTDEQAP